MKLYTIFVCTLFLLSVSVTPTDANAYLRFLDNFNDASFDPANGDPYSYFANGLGFVADDGVITHGPSWSRITAMPYNKTVEQGLAGVLDHVKNLFLRNKAEDLNPWERQEYRLRFSGRTFGTQCHPFPLGSVTNANDDPRLAMVAMNTFNDEFFVVADFAVSNGAIFTIYEILNFGWPTLGIYRAFTSMKYVAVRNSPTQIHNLRIDYNREEGSISWYVESQLVMKVDRIGYLPENQYNPDPDLHVIHDYGGTETLRDPTHFATGAGLFTLRDMKDPFNPSNDLGLVRLTPGNQIPSNFVDELGLLENRLDGAGAQITLHKMMVLVHSKKKGTSHSRSHKSKSRSRSHKSHDGYH